MIFNTSVQLAGVNITGHYYGAAVHFENVSEFELEMNGCFIEDNFNQGFIFEGVTANSSVSRLPRPLYFTNRRKMLEHAFQISILNSNFTQNRGSTLSLSLVRDTNVIVRGNSFTTNHLNDFSDHEAVLEISTFAETSGNNHSNIGALFLFQLNVKASRIADIYRRQRFRAECYEHCGGTSTPWRLARNEDITSERSQADV